MIDPCTLQTLDPKGQKAPDNKEGMYYGREVPADSELATKPFEGPNQWPNPVSYFLLNTARCTHAPFIYVALPWRRGQ